MAASLWLPQLSPPPLRSSLFLPSSDSCPSLSKKHTPAAARGNLLCSVSSTSSSVVTKQEEEAASGPSQQRSQPAVLGYKDDPNFRGAVRVRQRRTLKRLAMAARIQGGQGSGIAAVPGFGWWPIKAYRPCPGFVSSGGRYRRQGQSMDDVASGRGKKVSSGKKKR
ncbi:hypothetical protein PR202_ga24301 [Eleusine coracana subsp. coracana]|uniref:Uncharacterized protein n=1 Tax=Eleusine coracana subsp. coracana TaxID=191504 RepID=A0AAV5D8I6_ELECO|nr:hypothetical protein PR202_ga24301 [Eleusine coracana subsp. coracana]